MSFPFPLSVLLLFGLELALALFPAAARTGEWVSQECGTPGSGALHSSVSSAEAGEAAGDSRARTDCSFSLLADIQLSTSAQFLSEKVMHREQGSRLEHGLYIRQRSLSHALPGLNSEHVAHFIEVLPSLDAI